MRTKQELLLGKQAVAKKFITREQLKHCIKLQEQQNLPLPLIFLNEQLMDKTTLEKLMHEHLQRIQQGENKDRGEDLVLCRLLLRSQTIPPETFVKLLIEQKESNHSKSLAQLILQQQLVDLIKFLETYSSLNEETLSCPGCDKEFRLLNLGPGKKVRCKHCKSIFSVPTLEQEIASYDCERAISASAKKEESFAGYEIIEEIAQGGMGIIYRVQKKNYRTNCCAKSTSRSSSFFS